MIETRHSKNVVIFYLNMRFPVGAEKNGALPFLDLKIYKENGKFVTSVCRKETFSGVHTKFTNFIFLDNNFGLL